MTKFTITIGDGSGSDAVNAIYTIFGVKVSQNFDKKVISYPIPSTDYEQTEPERNGLDMKMVEEGITIAGMISVDSTNVSRKDAEDVKEDIAWLIKYGGALTVNWGDDYSNASMQVLKLQITENTEMGQDSKLMEDGITSQDTPTFYDITMTFLNATDI